MKEPKGPRVTKEDVVEKDIEEVLDDTDYSIYITPRGRKWLAADAFGAENLDVLKQECIDLRTECINLKERLANSIEEREKADRTVAEQMKTISKMQQMHEAEVQDLKDQLGEAKAAEAAAKKAHANAVGEKNNYADALDNDSIAFEEILGLAILMERGAKSMHEVSKMIQAKTEGRV